MFNNIALNGNTFRGSRSIGYDKEYVAVSTRFAYTLGNISITFVINDANILRADDQPTSLKGLTRFGSIGLSWRL